MDAAFTESDRGILIVFSKMTEMKKEFQLKKKISMIILFVSAITATLLTDWSLERIFNGVFKILHMGIFFFTSLKCFHRNMFVDHYPDE